MAVRSSIAPRIGSSGRVKPSCDGMTVTSAPRLRCASQMYPVVGKSRPPVTTFRLDPEAKSKQEATTERATEVLGCTCTEPGGAPRMRAIRSPTSVGRSHQEVDQGSSAIWFSQRSR